MKKTILTMLLVGAILCGIAQAQANPAISITYWDKMVWRGFELFGETDAIMPQMNLDIGPVSVDARGNLATDSGYGALERWDAQIAYTLAIEPVKLSAGYGYYLYPDSKLDFSELFATVGVPIGPATPRYTAVFADADGPVESAWLHVLGIDLDIGKGLRCFGEAVYNDGFNPFGGPVVSDWSHVLAGASLDVPISEKLSVTPALYYQRTLEAAVNPEPDQVWFSMSLAYRF